MIFNGGISSLWLGRANMVCFVFAYQKKCFHVSNGFISPPAMDSFLLLRRFHCLIKEVRGNKVFINLSR
jgi:hypothetical protein